MIKYNTSSTTNNTGGPDAKHHANTSKKNHRGVPNYLGKSVDSENMPQRTSSKGLPETLQRHLENRSGYDLSDVEVHKNSSEPEKLKAHAFTQGNHIYLGPQKEGYLSHEAWHVVQQKQGKVSANYDFNGQAIDSSAALEQEADVMSSGIYTSSAASAENTRLRHVATPSTTAQLAPNQEGTTDPQHLMDFIRNLEAEGLSREEILDRISEDHATNENRYIYTDEHGWVDLRHFGAASSLSQGWGSVIAETLGFGNEVVQWGSEWGDDYRSGFSPEDIPSNAAGAAFGDDYVNDDEALSDSMQRWLDENGGRTQDDPLAGWADLPETDPAVRGGEDRGSSNASRTQSTVSDNDPVNEFEAEWDAGWRALATPGGWYRLFGM